MREVETPDGGMSLKIVRVDCSAPCRSTDLALFSDDRISAPAAEYVVTDDDRD
jgi:hypothetical protein